jgi:hypothetical protein
MWCHLKPSNNEIKKENGQTRELVHRAGEEENDGSVAVTSVL